MPSPGPRDDHTMIAVCPEGASIVEPECGAVAARDFHRDGCGAHITPGGILEVHNNALLMSQSSRGWSKAQSRYVGILDAPGCGHRTVIDDGLRTSAGAKSGST